MPTTTQLDELVAATLEVSGKQEPWNDAMGLAYKLGLDPSPRACTGATVIDDKLCYDRTATPSRAQHLVADAIAEWALLQWELLAPVSVVKRVAAQLVRLPALGSEEGEPAASLALTGTTLS